MDLTCQGLTDIRRTYALCGGGRDETQGREWFKFEVRVDGSFSVGGILRRRRTVRERWIGNRKDCRMRSVTR